MERPAKIPSTSSSSRVRRTASRADREAGGQHRRVVQLGHEALVEVAQAVDELAVARLGRDDLDAGRALAQEAAGAHQRAGGAQARRRSG